MERNPVADTEGSLEAVQLFISNQNKLTKELHGGQGTQDENHDSNPKDTMLF